MPKTALPFTYTEKGLNCFLKSFPQNFGMVKPAKLTKKEESELCLACGECCKRYWITVLPEEATKIARVLNKPKKDFLENDCILQVKLFPKSTPGVLTFPSTFFPKRIFELLKKNGAGNQQSFFVVPQVVLKREEKTVFNFIEKRTKTEKRNACLFLSPENMCAIYEARPEPCKLFPFIAMPGLREQYPFCALFQQTNKNLSVESKIYYQKIQTYFRKIDNFGFDFVWRSPPKKGVLFLNETQIGEIALDELKLMMPKNN
jgi:Fe-S-cluster containining protein